MKNRFWWSMGDFDGWEDYNFMWTQWKSNKIIESLKQYKDVVKEIDVEDSLNSTHATDKDVHSSTENLFSTPKRYIKLNTFSTNKNQKIIPKPFSSGIA